jgi:CDP-diacylglycerol--glycerol-3-phosphate 3-phosphatidyltransferase
MNIIHTSIAPLLAIFALGIIGLPIFAHSYIRRGRPKTERIQKAGGSFLLNTWLMEYGYWFMGVPARGFVMLGLSPDAVTIIGLATITAGSVATGTGYFGLGGWLLVLGSMLDAMDGMVARAQGKSSDAGEFLDAVVDRYAEVATYIGFIWYMNETWWALGAVVAALLGSLMVSYVRAKAEALGIEAPSGIMRRHERALYIGLGTAMAPVLAYFTEPVPWRDSSGAEHPHYYLTVGALWIVGILANYSAVRSIWFVRNALIVKREAARSAQPRAAA